MKTQVDETCRECGALFKPHHHFVRCDSKTCPMKDNKGSLLDQLLNQRSGEERDSQENENG